MATPTTVNTWPLNGSIQEFDVTFDYLSQTFIKVNLVGPTGLTLLTLGTDYTFVTPTRIRTTLVYGPPSFTTIELRRETSTTERLVEFQDASILHAQDLNVDALQVMHVAEEARNAATETIGVNNDGLLDARGRRIVNLASPVDPLDAVNKQHFDTAVGGLGQAVTEASAARDMAKEWATKPTPVEGSLESSKTYSARAGASAGAAAASEAASLVNAQNSSASAQSASASAGSALNQANIAEGHKNSAAASAATATTKASEASASAASAAASAASVEPDKLVHQTSPTGVAMLPQGTPAQRPDPLPAGLLIQGDAEGKPVWYDRTTSSWGRLDAGAVATQVQQLDNRVQQVEARPRAFGDGQTRKFGTVTAATWVTNDTGRTIEVGAQIISTATGQSVVLRVRKSPTDSSAIIGINSSQGAGWVVVVSGMVLPGEQYHVEAVNGYQTGSSWIIS